MEQLTSDSHIDDGQFEERIDLVIKNLKEFMKNNNCGKCRITSSHAGVFFFFMV